jgi:hypothetical protein
MKDYSIYKYFKGEIENPFSKMLAEHEIENPAKTPPESMKVFYDLPDDKLEKLQTAAFFWFYESIFARDFENNESSDWYSFFGGARESKSSQKFMNLLTDEDYERPTEKIKADVFKLWLDDYLFVNKLDDGEKARYYATMDNGI